MSQQDVADLFCITVQAVSKWETGIALPDLISFAVLSMIFNVPPIELLDGEDDNLKILTENKRLIDVANEMFSNKVIIAENFTKKDFSGVKYSYNNRSVKCVFDHCNVSNVKLSRVFFIKCSMRNMIAHNYKVDTSIYSGCDLTGSDFTGAMFNTIKSRRNIINCCLKNVKIYDSSFSNESMTNGILDGAYFGGCGFSKMVFSISKITKMKFVNCVFYDVQFMRTKFIDCEFKDCQFTKTKFISCNVDKQREHDLKLQKVRFIR